MKRFGRWALRILAAVLFAALLALWVRSYWVSDKYVLRRATGELAVGTFRGVVFIASWTNPRDGSARASTPVGYSTEPVTKLQQHTALPARWSFLGFRETYLNLFGMVMWELRIPFWALAAIFTALPLGRPMLRAWQQRRRRVLGLCPICAYDLRASPEHCPECGHVP